MEENNNVNTISQETNETNLTTNSNVSNTEATDNSVNQTEESSKAFKVKYLHEEKEIPYEEAPTYIQKGMDYDRIRSKYEESKPVLSFVEELAQRNGMNVNEYLQAVKDYERQQEIESLSTQNSLDPELAEELYLLRQERQEREIQKQNSLNQEQQNKEYIDFVNAFPEVKPEDIPVDVWKIKSEENLPLKVAYKLWEGDSLKRKMQINETNQANASSSTGSLTGNGSSSPTFISYDTFNKNKNDRNWVMKNFKQINDSRKNW